MPWRAAWVHINWLLDLIKSNLDIIGILLVGIFVRTWEFGDIPSGFNQDEASTAYDAYAILTRGIDRNGFPFPLVLVAWGSGMQALPAYLQIPFMALLGANVVAARLPSLLLGIVSIPLLYVLIRTTIDKSTARIAAMLLAISPGHIMLSRWAHEACFFPGIFLIGVVLLTLSPKKPNLLFFASFVFGLSLYTYATAYLVVPVFLLITGVYGIIMKTWTWEKITYAAIIFIITALPLGTYLIINKFDLPSIITPLLSIPNLPSQPRYETMSNFNIFSSAFYVHAIDNLMTGWNLLKSQNDGLIWNAMKGFGVIYLFSLPFVLFGVGILLQRCIRRSFEPSFILIAWCITCVVLASFTSININRANIAIIPLVFCIAIALSFLRKQPFLFWPISALYLISFIQFTSAYFTTYTNESSGAFFHSLREALQDADRQTDGPICVTNTVNMPYIFALFHNKQDPLIFAHTVQYSNPGAEFQSVSSFGRYTFGLDRCLHKRYGAYVLHRDERGQFPESLYIMKDYELYSVAYPLP